MVAARGDELAAVHPHRLCVVARAVQVAGEQHVDDEAHQRDRPQVARVEGDPRKVEGELGAEVVVQLSHVVQRDTAEQIVLQKILDRLLKVAEVDPSKEIQVGVLRTRMVNAMAAPHGQIYFTQGMLDSIKKAFPDRPLDEHHDVLAAIMGHELVHILRGCTLGNEPLVVNIYTGTVVAPTFFRRLYI